MTFDPVTVFGIVALSFMLVCYMLEERAAVWTLLFAIGCLFSGAYGFLQGAWPFAVVEVIWFVVAMRRWRDRVRNRSLDTALRAP